MAAKNNSHSLEPTPPEVRVMIYKQSFLADPGREHGHIPALLLAVGKTEKIYKEVQFEWERIRDIIHKVVDWSRWEIFEELPESSRMDTEVVTIKLPAYHEIPRNMELEM